VDDGVQLRAEVHEDLPGDLTEGDLRVELDAGAVLGDEAGQGCSGGHGWLLSLAGGSLSRTVWEGP
jgi:hypothetical protein